MQENSEIFNYVVVNGQVMPAEAAQTWLFNPAYFYSFGVYETVKIDQGRPFYLREHLQRLLNSAAMIDLDLRVDVETLAIWFDRLHDLDRAATWSLKMLGLGELSGGQPLVGLQALPLTTYPDHFYTRGAKAILYEGERALPRCKSLNTLVNYLAGAKARQAGALEGLLHSNGYLSEGSRSSLFAVQGGRLLATPEAKVLPGITRDVLSQVMQATDCPIIEADLSVDLSLYEEMFITATSMHVMPITEVDGQPIGHGQVGPITQLAMERFNARYRAVITEAETPITQAEAA